PGSAPWQGARWRLSLLGAATCGAWLCGGTKICGTCFSGDEPRRSHHSRSGVEKTDAAILQLPKTPPPKSSETSSFSFSPGPINSVTDGVLLTITSPALMTNSVGARRATATD